ncbi:hypothetical protein NL108_006809 [Boleophthalmus pectinirostris]|nr:hypothetical protein NL108_006809 [Boleophthalmus pectinirostris]
MRLNVVPSSKTSGVVFVSVTRLSKPASDCIKSERSECDVTHSGKKKRKKQNHAERVYTNILKSKRRGSDLVHENETRTRFCSYRLVHEFGFVIFDLFDFIYSFLSLLFFWNYVSSSATLTLFLIQGNCEKI